jgi:hypothetical protein
MPHRNCDGVRKHDEGQDIIEHQCCRRLSKGRPSWYGCFGCITRTRTHRIQPSLSYSTCSHRIQPSLSYSTCSYPIGETWYSQTCLWYDTCSVLRQRAHGNRPPPLARSGHVSYTFWVMCTWGCPKGGKRQGGNVHSRNAYPVRMDDELRRSVGEYPRTIQLPTRS